MRMANRPSVFFHYPDSVRMIRVDADRIALDSKSNIGYADGNVVIKQLSTESQSGHAIMYIDNNVLTLTENPSAKRKDSEIKGDTLIISSDKSFVRQIYVLGNASGDFKEPSGQDTTITDVSELKGAELQFNFDLGELNNIQAAGQAYSFYSPGIRDSSEIVKNNVSGDTIRLYVDDKKLTTVKVIGGAEGAYLTGKYKTGDSGKVFAEDTIKYRSDKMDYSVVDSTIVLNGNGGVESKNMALTAAKVNYNVNQQLVTAYDDTARVDTSLIYIPVVLKDGSEQLLGSYLEYLHKNGKRNDMEIEIRISGSLLSGSGAIPGAKRYLLR